MVSSTTGSAASEQRTVVGIAVHLVGILAGVIGTGIMYLLSKREFSKSNARHALNWQLFFSTSTIVLLVVFFFVESDLVGVIAGFLLIFLFLLNFASCLWATVKAVGNEAWSYPLAPNII